MAHPPGHLSDVIDPHEPAHEPADDPGARPGEKTGDAVRIRLNRNWRNAIFVIFGLCGLTISSWLARTPLIRDTLGAGTGQMGWLMFALAAGSILGLSTAGRALTRFGAKRAIVTAMVAANVFVFVAALGVGLWGSLPIAMAAMIVFGFGHAAGDVGMNVEGAANERALGRTVMPLFHAAFSGGTVLGAALGALAEHLGLPLIAHLGIVTALVIVGTVLAVRHLQPHSDVAPTDPATAGRRASLWRDRRTLLIGVVVLGMALAEGSANDWLALAMVDGHGVSNATGAFVYGLFVTSMTVGRIAGVAVLDRYGRVPVLRATAALAVAGLLILILAPTPIAIGGVVLWGLGASLGFPVGMSAAADDPATAAARVSAVATIGYLAFLAGPPVIGFLGEHVGLLNALLVVLVLVAAAAFAASAAREPARSPGAGRP